MGSITSVDLDNIKKDGQYSSPFRAELEPVEPEQVKFESDAIDTAIEEVEAEAGDTVETVTEIELYAKGLTPKEVKKAEEFGAEANKKFRSSTGSIFGCAKEVHKANKLYGKKGCKGGFTAWREKYLPDVSRSTANRYIRLIDRFPKLNSSTVKQFELSALYELAALKRDDEKPLEVAVQAAKSGEVISAKRARDIIAEHSKHRKLKPSKSPSPEFGKYPTDFGVVIVQPPKERVRNDLEALQAAIRNLSRELSKG